MGDSTLISSTEKLTRQQLLAVPTPLGTATHRPVPHSEIVEALIETLSFRHIGVVKDEFAISRDGMKMFGVLDLDTGMHGCRFSIGVRNAHDKSMRLAMTVGYRVFVCENMAFSGDLTPCTIWQNSGCRRLGGRTRINPKDDLDGRRAYFDSLHQGSDDLSFTAPVGSLQALLHSSSEVFQAADEEKKLAASRRHFALRLDFSLQAGNAVFGALNARCELFLLDQALCIAVDKPSDCLVYLIYLRLK